MGVRTRMLRSAAAVFAALALISCAGGPPPTGQSSAVPAVSPSEARPLVAYVRTEPVSIATRPFSDKGAGLRVALRLFNALLVVIDDRGNPRPELLESLPQLHTDSWRV